MTDSRSLRTGTASEAKIHLYGREITLIANHHIDECGQFRISVTINTISGATKEIWAANLIDRSDA